MRVRRAGVAPCWRSPRSARGCWPTGGPAVLFEKPVRADGVDLAIPCLANLFGTVEARRHGRDAWAARRAPRRADLREVGELLAFLRQPEPPRGMKEALELLPLARTVMDMRPEDGDARAGAGGGADGRRDRSGPAAGADLLAGRAGAADHLAAGGDQGAVGSARGRLQPRHLPHAGDRPRPDHHALAGASRRRAAPSPLEGRRQARAAARLRGDRRRSGDHPGGGDAGARTRCRSTSSPACCAGPRWSWSRPRPSRCWCPAQAEIVIEGEVLAGRLRRRGPLRRPHRLLQLGRAVPGLPGHRHHHAARPDLPHHLHRPAARRAVACWARR